MPEEVETISMRNKRPPCCIAVCNVKHIHERLMSTFKIYSVSQTSDGDGGGGGIKFRNV